MSPDNIITNREVDAGTLPESQRENVPQQSLQVSANNLVNPPRATNLTPPVLETPPQTGTANAVSKDLGEIITAQTKEASDLRARRSEFAELGNLGTLGDFRTQQLADLGVPDNVRQLKDIQLQLADVDTASDLTKTRIQGGAGQTAGQAGREVTQEDRENAVRRSGLAAQASVLQGNIQTATTLVNQAVQTAYQDRTLKNSNLLNQINDLSGTVDNQTQQLLDQEKARIEADQAAVKEVKDSVALAMQSGAATPEEVAQLTDINATDADRLSLAQSITARGATQDRSLAVQQTEASIRSSNASARSSNANAAINEAELVAFNAAQADAEAGVLSGEQVGVAQDINKEFESQPIVKAYNEGLQQYIVLEDTLSDGIDGIQDLQLVYSFMKAVDPQSVVRESEFAMAAKTGNIFSGAYTRFNKGYFGSGGFLPDDVKADFTRAARSGFEAKNTQYYNVKAEKAKQINQRLGINNGIDYLTAYEGAAPLMKVDFDIADSLSNATPDEQIEIMEMSLQIGQSTNSTN